MCMKRGLRNWLSVLLLTGFLLGRILAPGLFRIVGGLLLDPGELARAGQVFSRWSGAETPVFADAPDGS